MKAVAEHEHRTRVIVILFSKTKPNVKPSNSYDNSKIHHKTKTEVEQVGESSQHTQIFLLQELKQSNIIHIISNFLLESFPPQTIITAMLLMLETVHAIVNTNDKQCERMIAEGMLAYRARILMWLMFIFDFTSLSIREGGL